MYGLISENELYHHGILGMKWGVRRYQNEDGTLTEAGKKRYSRTDWNTLAVVGARRDIKRSTKRDRTNKVHDAYSDKLDRLEEKQTKESQKLKDGYDSPKGRKLANRQLKEYDRLMNEAKTAHRVARLMDAGYSEESAKKGAEYLQSHGMNLEWTDSPLYWRKKD